MNKYLAFGIAAVFLIVGGWWYLSQSSAPATSTTETPLVQQQNVDTTSQTPVKSPTPTTQGQTARCWNGVCFIPPLEWSVRADAPHKLVYASTDFTPSPRGMGVETPATGYLLETSFGTATSEDLGYATPDAYVDAKLVRLNDCGADVCEEFHKQIVGGRPFVFMKSGSGIRIYGLYEGKILNIILSYSESSTAAPAIFSAVLSSVTFQKN